MKKWICKVISKLTFNKVCFNWCDSKTPNVEGVVMEKRPTKAEVIKTSVVEKKVVKKKQTVKKTKKKGKTIITEDMKKSFVKDRKSGMSFKAIGEKHNIPTSTITYHIKNKK
tara:strand:- start:12183 stop:12518 length:336 start_codon:yes stop_codon:yes gene_type:complete